MAMTKGRIEREGRVVFHDAKLAVWEEGIREARDAGGWEGANAWERQFKRDVFARIVQTLRRLGWHVGPSTHIFTSNNARYCRKGDLRADLRICGCHIELNFFQNVNAPDRPDHGGRYQYDHERHMPYLMRIEMERTRRRIRDYLCNVFTGYVFEQPKLKHGDGATALEMIEEHYRDSWHFKGDLTKYTISALNSRAADFRTLQHGGRVWFADRKGRICTGTAYYNINNMWWVVTGRYDYTNVAAFELYATLPENLRVKRNGRLRRLRLEQEMDAAVKAMQFERAATLRDILFPGSPALFNVWNDQHSLYHRAGFSGYTSDQSKAGKFTAAEVRGWNRPPNRVLEMAAREAA